MDLSFLLEDLPGHKVEIIIPEALSPCIGPISSKRLNVSLSLREHIRHMPDEIDFIGSKVSGRDYESFLADPDIAKSICPQPRRDWRGFQENPPADQKLAVGC